jgi:hypothetical protein
MAGGITRGFVHTLAASRVRVWVAGLCVAPRGGGGTAAVCPSPGKRVSEH